MNVLGAIVMLAFNGREDWRTALKWAALGAALILPVYYRESKSYLLAHPVYVRERIVAGWIITTAALIALAFHQIPLGIGLALVAHVVQKTLPKPITTAVTYLMIFLTIALPIAAACCAKFQLIQLTFWVAAAGLFAWLLVDRVRWNIRLFRKKGQRASTSVLS